MWECLQHETVDLSLLIRIRSMNKRVPVADCGRRRPRAAVGFASSHSTHTYPSDGLDAERGTLLETEQLHHAIIDSSSAFDTMVLCKESILLS